jgi:hypothetical protein
MAQDPINPTAAIHGCKSINKKMKHGARDTVPASLARAAAGLATEPASRAVPHFAAGVARNAYARALPHGRTCRPWVARGVPRAHAPPRRGRWRCQKEMRMDREMKMNGPPACFIRVSIREN